MPATLEPIKECVCTYASCVASFDTLEQMKNHKRRSSEHDYCHKCDEDFDSFETYVRHMAFRPEKHNKACRICGQEYKSSSGLRRHIELTHKITQELNCVGCNEVFYGPGVLIEHLEFGHCPVVSAEQFIGHVIHKTLVTKLLEGGQAMVDFRRKTSGFDATLDYEEEGGVDVDGPLEGRFEAQDLGIQAIGPESSGVEETKTIDTSHYPLLPSQHSNMSNAATLTSSLARMSLGGDECKSTTHTDEQSKSTFDAVTQRTTPWTKPGAAKALFPHAKSTPASNQDVVVTQEDRHINIMTSRFWDPLDGDYEPEQFYNSALGHYSCPFDCEEHFKEAHLMRDHILEIHRVLDVKCPRCLKRYPSVTALTHHCESRGSKCAISRCDDFNIFLDKVTGGFINAKEKIRPDHAENEGRLMTNPDTGRVEVFRPEQATFLEFTASKPAAWKEPKAVAAQIGGGAASGNFDYKEHRARW